MRADLAELHELDDEYCALEADACDHGAWPEERCEDCRDERQGRYDW